jgi:protein ImuB
VAVAGNRTLVAWYPDWPVAAAGMGGDDLVVVTGKGAVVAASMASRGEGVREGMRRREAQALCPELIVLESDPGCEARGWEPAVAAVGELTTAVEVLRPGELALSTRGPSRYFGGDQALGLRIAEVVDAAVGKPGCRVGVADGRFAAGLAARAGARGARVVVVPPGETRSWLAPLPVASIGQPDLADLLTRLGIRTLGDLAALPAPAILGRFGADGAIVHRLASGEDPTVLAAEPLAPDLAVTAELDPPAERVDTAAFVAKALAGRLHEKLAAHGLACSRVVVEAETEHGEHLTRRWRHEGMLDAAATSERVRWQLDGWLGSAGAGRPSGGLTLLRLVPEEVQADHGRQLGFWGGSASGDARAARAMARVQGLIGPAGVVTAVLGGGRDPLDQVRLVPWGDPREPALPGGAVPPWPGRLAGPSPALVYQPRIEADVRDASGGPVEVNGRGAASAAPAFLSVNGGGGEKVVAWAGPWPAEERWWDSGGRRRARFQVMTAGGAAHLISREGGRWWVDATYD